MFVLMQYVKLKSGRSVKGLMLWSEGRFLAANDGKSLELKSVGF